MNVDDYDDVSWTINRVWQEFFWKESEDTCIRVWLHFKPIYLFVWFAINHTRSLILILKLYSKPNRYLHRLAETYLGRLT